MLLVIHEDGSLSEAQELDGSLVAGVDAGVIQVVKYSYPKNCWCVLTVDGNLTTAWRDL